MELAEDILTAAYEVEEALRQVREAGGHGSENDDRPGREGENEQLRNYRDSYYPTFRRLRDRQPVFAALRAQRFRAKALFGLELEQAFTTIIAIQGRVNAALGHLYHDLPWTGPQTDERFKRHTELWEVVWEMGDDDEIKRELAGAIGEIERKLRPVIEGSTS